MTDNLPHLYSFRRCPYAIRARLAIQVSGLNVDVREVSLKSKPQEMLDASPKGTVPVLKLPNGRVIDESLDIMLWALGQNDPDGWLIPTGPPNALCDMVALIACNDGMFKHALDRYKYPNRYPDEANGDEKAFARAHRGLALCWLAELEAQLNQAWLFGNHASLADMAILPFIRQFAHTDAIWFAAQPWPRLQTWLTRFEASPLLSSVMTKCSLPKDAPKPTGA